MRKPMRYGACSRIACVPFYPPSLLAQTRGVSYSAVPSFPNILRGRFHAMHSGQSEHDPLNRQSGPAMFR